MSKNVNLKISDALKAIKKQFGDESVMLMWEGITKNVVTRHSGAYSLDLVLGGGYPQGRVVEIYGPESSWKTTICLLAMAAIQSQGGVCAFIDAEHAFDPQYARKLGVDVDNLILSQPDYGEQALSITEELAKTGEIDLIIVDSVAALVPKAEVEGEMGASHMGLQARMMSQGLRKLTPILSKTGTTVVFINQLRMKIGVMFGNPETTTGGNALKFYASQRLEIRKGDKIESNKEQVGYYAKIKIVKNKIFPPFKATQVPFIFNEGVDMIADVLDTAVILNLVEKNGAFYTLDGQKFQGKERTCAYLTATPKTFDELKAKIKVAIEDVRSGKKEIDLEVVKSSGEDESSEIDAIANDL
jgi:recombination protein RecA